VRRVALAATAALLTAACLGASTDRVVVAAGTTVVDSGFLDALIEIYEVGHPGAQISVVANPTQLALELGRQRTADLLITHAPAQEAEFAAEGLAERRSTVFTSRFVLVGPDSWLSRARGREIPEVFRDLAANGQVFVSRGDGSGTHDLEMEIWLESGLDPTGEPWYLVTGQGMGPTLLVADQRAAVTLAEIGAFLAARATISLVDLEVVTEGMGNPYSATVVKGSPGEGGAAELHDWLVSPEGKKAIEQVNLRLFGEVIYQPSS
jgi:tungstate transport system substrate-binding protein